MLFLRVLRDESRRSFWKAGSVVTDAPSPFFRRETPAMSQAILSIELDHETTYRPHLVDLPAVALRDERELQNHSNETQSTETERLVREAFAHSPIHAHRLLKVEQTGETLYLHGRLESFYYKQMAQEIIRTICSNVQLVNEIDVD